jgi:hypothetical protein
MPKPNIRFYAKMLRIFKGDPVGDGVDHFASKIADLVVEASDGEVTRAAALTWLLTHKDGRALLVGLGGRGTAKRQKEFEMPTRKDVLKGLLLAHGGDVVTLCKHIAKVGATDISEAELTGMIQAAAQSDRRSGETVEQCFARKFNDQSPNGVVLRKATRIASGFARRDDSDDHLGDDGAWDDPTSWSVRAKAPRADDEDTDADGEDAYDELCEEAEKLQKRDASLSFQQAFAKVYADNPALAREERRQNRPYLTPLRRER